MKRNTRQSHLAADAGAGRVIASNYLASLQIRLVFLEILLEHDPNEVDFDLVRERIAVPDSVHWNIYGAAVWELAKAKLIVECGVTRSSRPAAHSGKRSLWRLVNRKRAEEWVKAYKNVLPVDPQGKLFEQGGGK